MVSFGGFCFFPSLPYGKKNGMQPFGEDLLKQSISLTKHPVTPLCNLGMVTSAVGNADVLS